MRWAQLERSPGWALVRLLQAGRAQIAPSGSTRDKALEDVWRGFRTRRPGAFVDAIRRIEQDISWRGRALRWKRLPEEGHTVASSRFLHIDSVLPARPPGAPSHG